MKDPRSIREAFAQEHQNRISGEWKNPLIDMLEKADSGLNDPDPEVRTYSMKVVIEVLKRVILNA